MSLIQDPSTLLDDKTWNGLWWNALPDECFIKDCAALADQIDQRGPIQLRDGSKHKACRAHWEAIHSVLGKQPDLDDELP